MKKQLIALTESAALMTAATGAMAQDRSGERRSGDESNKRELVGAGSGAVIGAAAGGPVGMIIGAVFGGWLGDRIHQEHSGRVEAEQVADAALTEVASLRNVLLSNEHEVERLASQLAAEQRTHRDVLQEAINLQVMFRTADSSLDADSEQRLSRIAELIRPMSGVAVHLSGHADARGDEDYNRQLSAERAETVRAVLISAGVPADRIVMTAEGTRYANASPDDHEAMALDRRVQMRLISEAESRRLVALQQ
jgi:outer membrane protein OmpA-like peptidoglycan-associated protein